MVVAFAEMARHCGSSAKVEVTGIFNNVKPEGQDRMDLVVFDPGRQNLLYDMVVSNPVTAAVMEGSRVNLAQTEVKEKSKERQYARQAAEANMRFSGLACECYGKWGTDTITAFQRFISQGSATTAIPAPILANYWRRRLSVTLQKGNSNAINVRLNRLPAKTLATVADGKFLPGSSRPGLVEDQAEAYMDGALIPWGDHSGT